MISTERVSGTRVKNHVVERRSGAADRRQQWRNGRPGRRAGDCRRAAALFALVSALLASPVTASAQSQIGFGFDADSVQRARSLGLSVRYGSVWAGAWNQKWGWRGVEDQLRTAKAAGAVPVIQWWYWGDDISPSCVEHGCIDRYHGVRKDKATWNRLSNELADLMARISGPKSPALVVIETEFNKNGIENYEPFDGYLVEQAQIFHARNLRVIVSFGNWGRSLWKNFDHAIAAADLLGSMCLQTSVTSAQTYLSGADLLVDAARYLHGTFGKLTFVTDFGFSSYPEPPYDLYQDTVVRDVFRRLNELEAAGVQGMIWRMLADDPNFDTSNYGGMAERFWGILHADGSPKPAFESFRIGTSQGLRRPS